MPHAPSLPAPNSPSSSTSSSLSLSLFLSLFFGSDCEFKKQNLQQLKEKTHLQQDGKPSAQSIAEFRASTAGLSQWEARGMEPTPKNPCPGSTLVSMGQGVQAANNG